jgi:hypothetical protein
VTVGPVRFGALVFPSPNCDYDGFHVLSTPSQAKPHQFRKASRASLTKVLGA